MKGVKIDYTLKERRLIEDSLRQLVDEDMTLPQLERLGERLSKMGDQVGPILLERISACQDEALMSRYMFILESLDDERLVAPLIDILFTKGGDARLKARILSTLRYFDVPINGPVIGRLFPDALRPSSPSAGKFLTLLEENDLLLSLFLEGFYHLPREAKINTVKELARCQGEKALFLLDILAEGSDKEVALAAIEALGRVRSVKAARVLDNIIRRGLRPALVKAARRSRLRLMFLGIQAVQGRPPEQRVGQLYRAHVSRIDTHGNRYLWVARRLVQDSELIENVCLVINEECGLVDCVGTNSSEKEDFDSMIKRVKKEELVAEVSYLYALALLKDALAKNEATGCEVPAEFCLRKRIFGEDNLLPQEYQPTFPGYNLTSIARDRRLYLKAGELLDGKEFEGWHIDDDGIYDLTAELARLGLGKWEKAGSPLYRQLLEEAVIPRVRLLKRRLLLMADLLSQGHSNEGKVKLILAAALTLDKDLALVGCHPFVRRLLTESLKHAKQVMALQFNAPADYEGLDDL